MATSWQQFEDEVPELAQKVRARFEAHLHHVMATLTRDGSPRVSGTEIAIRSGEFTLGSMTGALKVADLLRDPRCALHANPGDGSMEGGDAKIDGRMIEVTDPDEFDTYRAAEEPNEEYHRFKLDIEKVVLISLHPEGDRMVIEVWSPAKGYSSIDRY